MQAEEILAQAKSGDYPQNWTVFPILRNKLRWGIVGWIFGVILGFGLFALVFPIIVPYNFEHGPLLIIFSLVLLGMFLFIGLGSLWTLIGDIKRLSASDKYILVFTPEDFVKQEGNTILQVPMANIRFVTARGVRSASRVVNESERVSVRSVPSMGENITSFFVGRGATSSGRQWLSKRSRTPTSLAFLNSETDKSVVVLRDEAYGNPSDIGQILKEYADRQHKGRPEEEVSSATSKASKDA